MAERSGGVAVPTRHRIVALVRRKGIGSGDPLAATCLTISTTVMIDGSLPEGDPCRTGCCGPGRALGTSSRCPV